MSKINNDYEETLYRIPDNFIDSGRILNGMFRTRYFIEGVVLAIIGFFIAHLFHYETTRTAIMVHVAAMLPPFLLGVVGINDSPISVFLKTCFSWRKTKAVYFYNGKPREQGVRPVDKLMSIITPRDKIIAMINKMRATKGAKEYSDYQEGVDYVFREDTKKRSKKETDDAKESKPGPVVAAPQPSDVHTHDILNIDGNDIFG